MIHICQNHTTMNRPKWFEIWTFNWKTCKQMATWLQLTGTPMGGDLSLLREAVAVAQHHDAVSGTEKQHVANDYARRLNQGVTECHKIIASYFKYERFTKLHLNQLYYVKLRRKGAVWASIFLAHHNLSHWKRAGSNELPIKFKPISTNSYRFGHDLIANWPKNCWNLFNMKVNEAAILEYFFDTGLRVPNGKKWKSPKRLLFNRRTRL